MDRRTFMQTASLAVLSTTSASYGELLPSGTDDVVTVDAKSVAGPLPHFWSVCAGSDRAAVAQREQWLEDLETVHKLAGIQSVRFHGLFNDEMGVWLGGPEPVFLYIDDVFDAMLKRGVRPFVELSFMPKHLASGTQTIFFYKGNTTPPNDLTEWGTLVRKFAQHCIDRYGLEEVRTWKFEVWNEPNIVFWSGTKAEYFDLYRESAHALKQVDAQLAVGGPATAAAAWVSDLLSFCAEQKVPIDFVSSHMYPDNSSKSQKEVFGQDMQFKAIDMIPRSLEMMRRQIRASQFPKLPLYLTEWASPNPAFIAQTIKSCIGLADILSYWTFDNVFEELGPTHTFMNHTFGMIGWRGIPRQALNTFILLNRLGNLQLEVNSNSVLATRRPDGSVAVLAWNFIADDKQTAVGDPLVQEEIKVDSTGGPKMLNLRVLHANYRSATVSHVDATHGSAESAYDAMGRPAYPTEAQIEALKKSAQLSPPERVALTGDRPLSIAIPANGVVLVEVHS